MSGALRCALYIRVSTAQQVDGNSLTTQKSRLLKYAKGRGYAVENVYVDAGLSAKNTDRPELQRLLADARTFDIVLVTKVDRISRSLKDLMGLIATLREHGVDFGAVDQQFDTSDPVGLLTLHLLGSFAQFERELLVERVKEGHLARVRKRDWSCGPAPFGYRKEGGKLVVVRKEAEVVRRVFDLYLELGSFRGVARRLNEENVPTRKGGAWSSGTVRQVLINPVYVGANVYGRHAKGDTRLKAREAWTVVKGMREAMVDRCAFEAVQKVIWHGKKRPRSKPERYLLSGLVRCGKCGSAMCGKADRKDGKVYRHYRCNGNAHRGKEFCEGTSVRADALEQAVLAKVHEAAGKGRGVRRETTDEQDARHRDARNALDRVKYRITKLFELYENGDIDREMFRGRMEKLEAEREQVQSSLALETSANGHRPTPSPTGRSRPADDAEEDCLRDVAEAIVVNDTSAEIRFAGGGRQPVVASLLPECDELTLGDRLRKWRLEAGLRQRDVARMLGVDAASVRNWELGRCRPRGQAVQSITGVTAGAG